MKLTKNKAITAALAAMCITPVWAETVTWNTLPGNATDATDNANPMTFTSDTTGFGPVDLTGFRIGTAVTENNGGGSAGEVQHRNSGGNRIARAHAYGYGVGVNASSDSSHTIDSAGYFDAVLLDFGEGADISLDTICLWSGWAGNYDTDFNLYRYAGSNTLDLSDLNHDYAGLAGTTPLGDFNATDWSIADWDFTDQVDWDLNDATRPANQQVAQTTTTGGALIERHLVSGLNSGGLGSRYWLISAVDQASPFSNYKLNFVQGFTPPGTGEGPGPVPAPSTLLLLLPGLVMWRRHIA